jgi:hypothetical protein
MLVLFEDLAGIGDGKDEDLVKKPVRMAGNDPPREPHVDLLRTDALL